MWRPELGIWGVMRPRQKALAHSTCAGVGLTSGADASGSGSECGFACGGLDKLTSAARWLPTRIDKRFHLTPTEISLREFEVEHGRPLHRESGGSG